MKKPFFKVPLYWLSFLILIFLTLSIMPVMAGYVVTLLANGETGREAALRFNPFFPSIVFFLSSFILSLFISLALWFKILIPLSAIRQAARRVSAGDFSVRLPKTPALPEIQDLNDNFNRMVQELNSIESLRNDFVTTISHEFKTPLAAIEGYATLLQTPELSESDRKEYARIIIDSTRQLTTMTGNILLLSRLEKQEIVTNRSSFKLDEQIRQTILLLEPLWEKKQLELDIDLEPVRFYGNSEMLFHVWMNLIQNAIKFTPEKGLLSVGLQASKTAVVICVKDSGIGMDEPTRKRIFEKFYSGSQNQSGNGLGLSIVKRIVDLSCGSIQVESRPGEGSCFTVTLPRSGPL